MFFHWFLELDDLKLQRWECAISHFEQGIRAGGSTAPYLIKQLSVWDETERGREGTERENIDGRASTSGLSQEKDRGVIAKPYTKSTSTLSP